MAGWLLFSLIFSSVEYTRTVENSAKLYYIRLKAEKMQLKYD